MESTGRSDPNRQAGQDRPIMANLACGHRWHPAWLNFDRFPASPQVKRADLRRRIPLRNNVASAVYHSHLLEHFTPALARPFLGECLRVLKPGGILRIVVPDLEQSARDYVAILDRLRAGAAAPLERKWLVIEMIDQIARTRPGGELDRMIREHPEADPFILPRLGAFGPRLIEILRDPDSSRSRFERRLRLIETWLPGRCGMMVADALFRRRGENHRWMYDEFSLGDLMRESGLADIRRMTPTTSQIPGWSTYRLDGDSDQQVWKGTSLYMEGCKP